MANKKYSGEFKCAVVRHYLETREGYMLTARHFSINRTQVRTWLRLYRSQGYAGLLKRQLTIQRTLAFKQHVIETMLNESLSLAQASARFEDISSPTILQWRRLYDRGLLDGKKETSTMSTKVYRPDRRKPDSEKTPEELLRELQYMRAEVAYLKKLNELELQEAQAQKKSFAIKKSNVRQK